MEYALVGLLILFLIYLFFEMRQKAQRVKRAVTEQKRAIAEDSGMTACIGVFSPDTQTTVIIAASEELGVFYYRMLRQSRVINRSRINLANLARVEFLLNGKVTPVSAESGQPTTSLQATDIADRAISHFSPDAFRQILRGALRIVYYDEAGVEKILDITSFRANDERQKFERVQLLKNTVWWVSFLQISSRQARRVRAKMDSESE